MTPSDTNLLSEAAEPLASAAGHPKVEGAFKRLVERVEQRLKGRLGFSALHIESGARLAVAGGMRFPMASTYKVPMAGLIMARIDRGELSLDQRVEIGARHFEETGDIAQSVPHPGVSLSLANLIELMLTQSNNNATDRILDVLGGPSEVTAWLRSLGIEAMRVDNNVNDLLGKFYGLPEGAPSMKAYLAKWTSEEERERINGLPQPDFDEGVEDTTTPDAMVELLRLLFASDLLAAHSRTFLDEVMTRCQTGPGRIKGALPPDTIVAHKTGTVGGTVNDAGIIYLPDRKGRVALAIYTKGSPILPYTAREPMIAEIARSVFDYFAFTV